MHIMGLLRVQRMLMMYGNANASEHGESKAASLCGDLDQDYPGEKP